MSRENNTNYLVIALPSGKLLKPSIQLFEGVGIDLKGGKEISRKLTFFDQEEEIKFVITRPKDNPTYVECGAADIGIVGEDVLLEEKKDVYRLLDLKFGKCNMVVAVPEEKKQGKYYKNNGHRLRVATKYPRIAGDYFKKRGIYVELIKLYGSVELAPQVGLADMIVDIVSTGRTLMENKLTIVDEIIPLSAQLIVNRISYKTKHKRITRLLQDIKKFISLESDKIAEW
ncbi:MAG: ATP phosphoribosyltransferase [Candidatus Atribacteria bacterium]|nr:ATP phosphoribosyltransferase [Candidatus Atribacteria bacterium]